MFLISWLIAHWKVIVAACVAIIFFSYRVNRISQQQQPQENQQEEQQELTGSQNESKQQQMSHNETDAEPVIRADGSAAFPHTAHAEGASQPSHNNNNNNNGASNTAEGAQQQQQQKQPSDEQVDTTFDEITGLFANRNPKHILHGVSDAVRNVATGVGLGVAGVAAGTYGGASEGGWKGMAKGFGAGMCGLVGLTGYGLYAGARQVVRGVSNTPTAVSEVNKGEAYWDSNAQRWVRVNLAHDLDGLPLTDDDVMAEGRKAYAKAEKEGTLPTMAPTPPADHPADAPSGTAPPPPPPPSSSSTPGATQAEAEGAQQQHQQQQQQPAEEAAAAEPADYYAFLGVEKTATTSEIRKAYTRKALEMHPDKNPDDPTATLKFQQLNKIYSVLSNEDTRAAYDRYGSVDPQNVPEMASNPMKDMLGAAFLEPLVGQLHFFLVFEGGVLLTTEMMQELHARRRLRVAKNLVSWLDSGASGLEAAQLVLRDAVSTTLGPVLVSYVAEQYHLSSRQQLYGSTWAREMDSWYSSWAMSASSLWHWTTTTVTTARRALYDKNLGEEDILRVLAVANESDVKRIVLQACRLVLFDTSVTVEQRRQRAVGLERLSEMAMEEVKREITSRESAAAIAASEAQTATSAAAAEGESNEKKKE